MDKIKIFENFLTNVELEECIKITCLSKWEFGHYSVNVNNVHTPFWYMELIKNDFLINIKDKIERITGKKFNINRIYANGQTYGQNGTYHQDDVNPNCYTFCLYISPTDSNMIDEINGNLQFKISELKPFIVELEPLCNRGILFPSNYFHKGNSFSRYVPNLRISIAWKLEEIV